MKSDAERGPFGAWAYHARDRLEPLTVEQVAAALSYSAPTLRKVEGGSAAPSRRMRRDLPDYYARLAAARGIALPAAPAADGAVEPAGLLAAVEAFTRSVDIQTQRLDRLWERMGDLIERLDAQQPLNREDAQVMAEGLADGIGASLAGAISDLADALRRPSPAGRGERA